MINLCLKTWYLYFFCMQSFMIAMLAIVIATFSSVVDSKSFQVSYNTFSGFFTKLHDACIYISVHSIRIMWWVAKQQWVSSFILKLYSLQFQNDEVEAGDDVPYSYGFFHFILSTGAMYFHMLFISWNFHQTMQRWVSAH